jgi:hypothetical protein
MSLIVTPPINSTETFQVATPFSYSFTYPTVIQTTDKPRYYFGTSVFGPGPPSSNSTLITCYSTQNLASGYGLTYTVSNMTATTDVLECVLPIPTENYTFNAGSYVTFGGPNPLYLTSTLSDPYYGTPALYTAIFGGVGFAYGLYRATTDSLKYIPLAGSPVSAFKIVLARPGISNASVYGPVVDNLLEVREMNGSEPGQVTVGMVFDVGGIPCTVTAYGTGHGGTGTYTLTRNSGSGNVNMEQGVLTSSTVVGSGDVVLSSSMTPSDGTAKFEIYTNFTYTTPPGQS